ncbi:hypothetical protein J4443_02795 [Candidatus Woesearchaeota archaeon]|nr:hypothetical protein [Candidatus Woesearchaeota archaeon]
MNARRIVKPEEVMPSLELISGVSCEEVVSKIKEESIEFKIFGPRNSGYYFRDSDIYVPVGTEPFEEAFPVYMTRSYGKGVRDDFIKAVYGIFPSINKKDLRDLKRMRIRFDKEGHLLERITIHRDPWFRSI